jgi:hypothetical protein
MVDGPFEVTMFLLEIAVLVLTVASFAAFELYTRACDRI